MSSVYQPSVLCGQICHGVRGHPVRPCPSDHDAGVLRLALGGATTPGSTLVRLAEFVKGYVERLRL